MSAPGTGPLIMIEIEYATGGGCPGIGSGGLGRPVSVERSLVFPGGPYDACQAIRESHRGTITTTTLLAGQRPRLEPMQGAFAPAGELAAASAERAP